MREMTDLTIRLKGDMLQQSDDLLKCSVCGVYVHKEEFFTCPRCRRTPLCRKHRIGGMKECASCVFDMRKKDLNALYGQEMSIKQFLSFLQFVFLGASVFFVGLKFGLAEHVEILRLPLIDKVVLAIGTLSVACYILFRVILYNQRGKIDDVMQQIRKLEVRQ